MIDSTGAFQPVPLRVGPHLFTQEADPFRQGLPERESRVWVRQVKAEERRLDRAEVQEEPLDQPKQKDQVIALLETVCVSLVEPFPP